MRDLVTSWAENGFLRADRDELAEALILLWATTDREEWDGKAIEHFDSLVAKFGGLDGVKNKGPDAAGFWHTANCSFSKKERNAFNAWKLSMYIASEKVRDAAHHLPDEERFADVALKARAMYDMVCAIPALID